ncbi:putative ATP-dependent RNA helicase Dbp73D [Oratosquilla oratoria]|uniref:putative ATP-dependent RNA helicase Dbp73D n=1 Tax=Oratosquilla oratoria TaxID=337810 RepID=UPI003F76ACFF
MESPVNAPKRYWGANSQESQGVKSHSALLLERINARARARKERRQSLPNKTPSKIVVDEGKDNVLPEQFDYPPNGSTKTLNGVRDVPGETKAETESVCHQKKSKKAKRKERLSLPLAENRGIVDDQFMTEVTMEFKAKKRKKDRIGIEESGDAVEETDVKPNKEKRKKKKRKEVTEEDSGEPTLPQEVESSSLESDRKKDDLEKEMTDPTKDSDVKSENKKEKKRKRKKEEVVEEDSKEHPLIQEAAPEENESQKDISEEEKHIELEKETNSESDKGKKKNKWKQEKEEVLEENVSESSLSKQIEPLVPKGNQVEVKEVVSEEHQRDASLIGDVGVTLLEEKETKALLITENGEAPHQETETTEKSDQGEVGEYKEETVKKKKKKKNKLKTEEEAAVTQEEMVVAEEQEIQEETCEITTADKENESKEGEQLTKDIKKEKKKKKKSKKGEEMKGVIEEEQIDPDVKEPVGTSGDKDKEDNAQAVKKKEKKKKKMELKLKDFTILGEADSAKKTKVQRVLPHWLANPTLIQRDLQTGSSSIDSIPNLHPKLVEKLKECDVQNFFPVQKAVIPDILATALPSALRYQPRDICVSAPTGSGKTLAFVLPIVQALSGRVVPKIRALVLLPVQELALQVFKVFQTYCEPMGLTVGAAVGLKPFAKEQTTLFRHCYGGTRCLVDILVATPGRLSDHLSMTKGLDFSQLRYFVLDEADKMLATEGGEWIAHIEKEIDQRNASLPAPDAASISCTIREPLQRLLFSATLSHDPEQLQQVNLHRPRLYTVVLDKNVPGIENGVTASTQPQMVGQYTRPSELIEQFVVVEASVKPLLLYHLIKTHSWKRTLIFTNSLEATHKLAILLNILAGGMLRVFEFSSRHGRERHKIKSKFAAGKIDILVSSDAMARGLDIPDIEHVVSYDVTSVSTYVHRIGRTARAGKEGTALSLVTKDLVKEFRSVLSNGGGSASEISVPTSELESYETAYVDALAKMKEILDGEKLKEKEKRDAANAQHRLKGNRGGKSTKLNPARPNTKLKGLKRLGRDIGGRPYHWQVKGLQ